MKEIWVNADPWNKKLVTTALEAGADAVIVPAEKVSKVKNLGLIKTVSADGDLKWDVDVVYARINSRDDEDEIVRLAKDKKVIIKTSDWKIIPLENLVARSSNIFVEVEEIALARTVSAILEKGVDGIIIKGDDPVKIREIVQEIKSERGEIELTEFKITDIHPVGLGDRVCIDTCSIMKPGEGGLVGNSSRALFLIHAESMKNPYVSPRPFRINAGAVHAYVLTPGGKTKYLCELGAGDEIIGVNSEGQVMTLVVGRTKIERRPLLLIKAMAINGEATIICQNAETIHLAGVDGSSISVVKVRPGDEVLGHFEEGGRHFGHKIEETVIEK